MITNYSDPIVTLNQEFRLSDAGNIPLLGACIIGPSYHILTHDSLLDSIFLLFKAGLIKDSTVTGSIKFPSYDSIKQGAVKVDSIKLYVKNARVLLDSYTEGQVVLKSNILTFSSLDAKVIKAGDTVLITYTDSEADSPTVTNYIQKILKQLGKDLYFVYLLSSLPSDISESAITNVAFYGIREGYIASDLIVRNLTDLTISGQWERKENISTVEITSKNDIKISLPVDTNTSVGKKLESGNIYIEYVVENTTYLNVCGILSNKNYVELTLGKASVDNPLALAVKAALTLTEGNNVYFLSVSLSKCNSLQEMILSYIQAIDLVADKDNQYGIVPCTSNAEVLKGIMKYIKLKLKEDIPVLKYLYASVDIPKDGFYPLLCLSLKDSTSTFTVTEVSGDGIIVELALVYFLAIKKGDVIKTEKGTFTIEGANAGTHTIFLSSKEDWNAYITEGTSVTVLHKVVENTLELNNDHIKHLIKVKPVTDYRASVIFADGAYFSDGSVLGEVPNYVVAAALAGRRSSSYPHAPLSNIVLKEIATKDLKGFNRTQLNTLGANGFWRVGQNSQGLTISRRQLTSAASDNINKDLQSIICNVDSICMKLKNTGRSMVGNTNITPVLLEVLLTTLKAKLASFLVYVDDFIGPQLLSSTLLSIRQDSKFKDRIYALMEGLPPKPFNRFHMKFYIN